MSDSYLSNAMYITDFVDYCKNTKTKLNVNLYVNERFTNLPENKRNEVSVVLNELSNHLEETDISPHTAKALTKLMTIL